MEPATLIYDGDCPFCSRYVQYVQLKKAVGDIRLIDARDGGPEVDTAVAQGYDLDEGMILILGGTYYYGDACLNRLALMSSQSDIFNKLNSILFRSPVVSRISYPILRFGRNTILKILGRKKINQ